MSNILAQPLIVLAPLLAARGRRIALSGILDEQAEEVMRAYRPWFDIELAANEERWVLLAGRAAMSLVTRCPNCGTAFRVQRDQLSARSGTVRCGKCGDMFDGVAALVVEGAEQLALGPSPQLGLFDPSRRPAPAAAARSADAPLPAFLEDDEPPSRWRGALWLLLSVIAFGALCAQLYRVRTEATVVLPELRPALEAACRVAGCTVPLPRRPELIRIVSDDMHDDPQSPGVRSARPAAESRALPAAVPGDRAHADRCRPAGDRGGCCCRPNTSTRAPRRD